MITAVAKTLAQWMEEAGISADHLVAVTGFDNRLVKAVISGQFTPSPNQRQRLAAAMGLSADDISWGHTISVQHLRGNGPQAGRST